MARINIKLEKNKKNKKNIRFINIIWLLKIVTNHNMIIDYRQYYIVLFIFIYINIFAVCTLFAYKC